MLLPRHVISATTAVTLKRHIRDHIKASDLKQLNFTKDSENRTVVYTDGCCLFNNSTVEQRQSGLGVFWGVDHVLNLSLPIFGKVLTSNRSEILAVHAAILTAMQLGWKDLSICSDSMHVINSCQTWLKWWAVNNWNTSTGAKVKNLDLWKPLQRDLKRLNVSFTKQGEDSNGIQMAHNLANAGAKISRAT